MIVSVPPRVRTLTLSMPSRSIVIAATSRVRGRGRRWPRASIFSPMLEPLKSSVSLPPWPSTTSLPSPGSHWKVSSPAPSWPGRRRCCRRRGRRRCRRSGCRRRRRRAGVVAVAAVDRQRGERAEAVLAGDRVLAAEAGDDQALDGGGLERAARRRARRPRSPLRERPRSGRRRRCRCSGRRRRRRRRRRGARSGWRRRPVVVAVSSPPSVATTRLSSAASPPVTRVCAPSPVTTGRPSGLAKLTLSRRRRCRGRSRCRRRRRRRRGRVQVDVDRLDVVPARSSTVTVSAPPSARS